MNSTLDQPVQGGWAATTATTDNNVFMYWIFPIYQAFHTYFYSFISSYSFISTHYEVNTRVDIFAFNISVQKKRIKDYIIFMSRREN